jgi:hypothetical protein
MPEMWKNFLKTVNHELDTLVCQIVNQNLFEEIVKGKFSVELRKSSQASLTCDEECIVRYMSG